MSQTTWINVLQINGQQFSVHFIMQFITDKTVAFLIESVNILCL